MTDAALASPSPARRGRIALLVALNVALLALGIGAGWLWAHRHDGDGTTAIADEATLSRTLADAGIDPKQRGAIESLVHAYIVSHPEVLSEAVETMRSREAVATLGPLRPTIETPFPGAVLGNPKGKLTLVEFTDFSCGYCRKSEADVAALIAANPELKVVVRQLPIIGPGSEPAARMGLAAAQQGKYAAFHERMFAAAPPTADSIAASARAVGVDMAKAKDAGVSQPVTHELEQNLALARTLGITGTPGWIVGDQLLSGAVGQAKLQSALDAARARG